MDSFVAVDQQLDREATTHNDERVIQNELSNSQRRHGARCGFCIPLSS